MFDKNKIYKCVCYQRVSTKNESQAESCEHQKMLADDFLDRNKNFILVANFQDDGISGKSDDREDYQKMIQLILQGDIDFILVKDNYRLCRSAEVNSALNRILVETNTRIIYLADNSIYDPHNRQERLFNGIKALLGEDYVHQQSENGKLYHMQKCMNKIVNANNTPFAYFWDKEEKTIKVNTEKSWIIEKLFEWYVFQNLGVMEISKRFAKMGVLGEKSKKPLTAKTLNHWLQDSAYKGQLCFNKRRSILGVGMNAKTKRVDIPKEEWVVVPCPPIISEKLFDLAQKIREERNHTYNQSKDKEVTRSYFKGFHLFSTKLFCGECGTQFHFGYTDREKKYPLYKDYFPKRSKQSLDEECANESYNKIYEETLKVITRKSFNFLLENKQDVFDDVVTLLREVMTEETDDSFNVKTWKKKINELEKKKESFLQRWFEETDVDAREFCLREKDKCVEEINRYNEMIASSENKKVDLVEIEERLKVVQEYLLTLKNVTEIDRDFTESFLNRIDIYGDGKIFITFNFSKQRVTTTLPEFKEERLAFEKGMPSIHRLRSLKELLFFSNFARKIGVQGMMVVCPRAMEIPYRICSVE